MRGARKIIHIDMDCFFAAVEQRENPSLKGIPFVVGGNPEGRGVVATANYEARVFGIGSAMSCAEAKRRCPSLTFVRPRMALYREASIVIQKILHEFSDQVEAVSIDEAYLDISESRRFQGSATWTAQAIKKRIVSETGLTASAGVAPNCFLAKVASDWSKPDGLTVIPPGDIPEFMKSLPVNKIPGVGKVTGERLKSNNIHTCGDLQKIPTVILTRLFGIRGLKLKERSFGIDHREVNLPRTRKSLSVEHTFTTDTVEESELQAYISKLYLELINRLDKKQLSSPITGVFVKVKFNDFSVTTAQRKAVSPLTEELFQCLMKSGVKRKSLPVRLLGLGVRFGIQENLRQLSFPFEC